MQNTYLLQLYYFYVYEDCRFLLLFNLDCAIIVV